MSIKVAGLLLRWLVPEIHKQETYTAGAGEELSNALQHAVVEGLGGEGQDELLVRQAGEVLDHAVNTALHSMLRDLGFSTKA